MKPYGAPHLQMKNMNENDIFLLHLHLLIVMVKAALKGYPIGDHRKNAVLENAAIVHRLILSLDLSFLELKASTHLFQERVKLLSVMAAAVVNDEFPLGIHRREAVLDNIEIITEMGLSQKNMQLFHNVLKVA
jgi:hypothetical protein